MLQIGNVKEFGKAHGFKKHSNFRLHYIVFEQKSPSGDPGFSAAGLELGFFSWSETIDGARTQLSEIYRHYLEKEDLSTDDIFYSLSNPNSDHLWGYYRQLSFAFGEPTMPSQKEKINREEIIEAQSRKIAEQEKALQEKDQIIANVSGDLAEVSEELMFEKITTDGLRKQLILIGSSQLANETASR
jgi:hypothetical protein